jgi:hypothetical protein
VTTFFIIDLNRISFFVLIHLSLMICSSHSQVLLIATEDFALKSAHPTLATLPSLIGRLPPEFLETMFLEVVSGVKCPSSDSEDSNEQMYRWGSEIKILDPRTCSDARSNALV